MARALRLQISGGRYHVTARGNERRQIFCDDTDRFRFLELLSELGQRFGTRVHAYVLMDNHYHLLVETPEPNLSRAMQWCNVSYSVWFNLRQTSPEAVTFTSIRFAWRAWGLINPPGPLHTPLRSPPPRPS